MRHRTRSPFSAWTAPGRPALDGCQEPPNARPEDAGNPSLTATGIGKTPFGSLGHWQAPLRYRHVWGGCFSDMMGSLHQEFWATAKGGMMSSDRFWLRSGPTVPFDGLGQDGRSHCVYASVAGAMNHVSGVAQWTVDALFRKCLENGHTSPTFDTVMPIAVEPVKDLVSWEIARERMKRLST